jgi:hypothetical protein
MRLCTVVGLDITDADYRYVVELITQMQLDMSRHLTPVTVPGYAREVNLLADIAAALPGWICRTSWEWWNSMKIIFIVELHQQPQQQQLYQPGAAPVPAAADSRRSGVGLAPRPQALPMPAAALVSIFIFVINFCRRILRGLLR